MDVALNTPLPNIELGCNLSVVAVTPDLVAVNKPSGIHSAPLALGEISSVLNAVIAIHHECAQAVGRKSIEGTLLHRLDRGTSGILLFARTPESYKVLRRLWEERLLTKDYLAWVEGALNFEGSLNLTLAHDPKSKKKMVALETLGAGARRMAEKERTFLSRTEIHMVKSSADCSLAAVRIHTGVMHQVRVSLAALGHPVMGDPVYHAAKTPFAVKKNTLAPQDLAKFAKMLGQVRQPNNILLPEQGFFLHAWRVGLAENALSLLKRENKLADATLTVLSEGLELLPPVWFGTGRK